MANIGKTTIAASSVNLFEARVVPVVAPAAGTLESVSAADMEHYTGPSGAENFRIAVYTGGVSNTDPTGATLLEDLGQFPNPTGGATWNTVTSTTHPTFALGARLWIGFKHNGPNTAGKRYDTTTPGDFVHTRHRGSEIDPNPEQGTAWPATSYSGTGLVNSAYPSLYLTYTPTGGGGSAPAAPTGMTATAESAGRKRTGVDGQRDGRGPLRRRARSGQQRRARHMERADRGCGRERGDEHQYRGRGGPELLVPRQGRQRDGDSAYATTPALVLTKSTPVAQIDTPATGTTIPIGSTITLTGGALDANDGALTGARLVWTSDIDGLIGTGSQVISADAGNRSIRLEATDSDSNVASTRYCSRSAARRPA